MPKTRRRHADREQFWQDTITAWKESGRSVRAFCTARGVPVVLAKAAVC